MARFYCTYNSETSTSLNLSLRIELLQNACNKLAIPFFAMDQAKADFSSLPVLSNNDGLYNCSRGSYLLENALLNTEVRTFYRSFNFLSIKDDNGILQSELERSGVSCPRSIHCGTNDRSLLNKYQEQLNGFPLILKVYGHSGGVGVILIESFAALISTADHLKKQGVNFQLKEFIAAETVERATVLGDKVLYCISRKIPKQDFRTNYFEEEKRLITLDSEAEKLAVKASHACNYNFAGVDMIWDKKTQKWMVLEVNFPQNFAVHEIDFNTACSEHMLKWLFKPNKKSL